MQELKHPHLSYMNIVQSTLNKFVSFMQEHTKHYPNVAQSTPPHKFVSFVIHTATHTFATNACVSRSHIAS